MLVSTNYNGLEFKVKLLEEPIDCDKLNSSINRDVTKKELWERHKRLYSDKVKIEKWQELILGIRGIDEINPDHFNFNLTTSYFAQLFREQPYDDVSQQYPCTVGGVIHTSDNKFMLGVRSGFVQRSKISFVPFGYLSAEFEGNPISDNFFNEGVEEVGILQSEIENSLLLGYQTDPQFTKGINFIVYGRTDLSSSDLTLRHNQANEVYSLTYQRILQETNDRSLARKRSKIAVSHNGMPNIDAGDHQPIFFIDDSKRSIKDILSGGKIILGENHHDFISPCFGTLLILERGTYI